MKYQSGQTVTLLDTYFKPAGTAVVIKYQEYSDKYEVDFRYPGNDTVDQISVPEERLMLPTTDADYFNSTML
jgi:hypothetical protein